MAREAILRDTDVRVKKRFTCASGTTIAKGTFLKLSGDNTVIASTGTSDIFAGFAHHEKDGTDYSTSVTASRGGVYELTASGAIVLGWKVVTASPGNYVKAATAADVASTANVIVGVALETASDGEQINVDVTN